jgi:hypothetical protein
VVCMVGAALNRGRVRPGMEDRLREWFEELRDRRAEVRATLEDEAVWTETTFIEHRGGKTYLWYYLEAEDVEAALETDESSDRAIDREHAAVLEATVESWKTDVATSIGHFVHPDRGD